MLYGGVFMSLLQFTFKEAFVISTFLLVSLLFTGASKSAESNQIQILGKDGNVGKEVPITVINNSDKDITVERKIKIEVQKGDKWELTDIDGVLLRKDCESDSKGIVTSKKLYEGSLIIKSKETFNGAPWLGMFGDAQCACEKCVPVEPGIYRYKARLKDGAYIIGQSFELKKK